LAILRAADITELAMELEKSGEAFYRAVAVKMDDPDVRALFGDLAEQEATHYKVFQELARSIREQPFMTDEEWDMYQDYLDATVHSAFFEGADKALSAAGEVKDKEQALRMAIGFEKETMLFFHDLYEKVPEGGKGTVERVIAEERRHVQRLARML